MSLISTKELLQDAYRNRYAVGAFAAHNLEILKAVCQGASKADSPIIIQTTPGTVKYLGAANAASMVREVAEEVKIPIALHLDHGDSFTTAMKCLRAGYTSIMIDGSHLPFEENISLVNRVTEAAHAMEVPVEAELGTIGGVEDDLEVGAEEALLTDPYKAAEFVNRTKIDFFAPAFGTAHGLYKVAPKLRFDLLERMKQEVDIPIVMHGASGVPDEDIKRALQLGVAKVNFSTELKVAFAEELKTHLLQNPYETDPRKYFLPAMEAVAEIVQKKIELLGSSRVVKQ